MGFDTGQERFAWQVFPHYKLEGKMNTYLPEPFANAFEAYQALFLGQPPVCMNIKDDFAQ